MEVFVWWVVQISMKAEWRCALMTSGGQCVMMAGTVMMLLWSASNWVMHTLEVSASAVLMWSGHFHLRYFTCDTGGTPYYNAFFGAGTGPIYLDDVACTSNANQLLECSSRQILAHNCDHHADAGVGCEGMFILLLNLIIKKQKDRSNIYIYYYFSSMRNWSTATSRR